MSNGIIPQQEVKVFREASQMADKFLDEGDIEGHSTWMRILEAIESFEDKIPSGTVH